MKKLLTIVLACLLLVGCILPAGAVEYGAELRNQPNKEAKSKIKTVIEEVK